MNERPQYVVITPAHNEEALIEKTICSMVAQTVRPSRWMIVNDGSRDRTREIVESYARAHTFIRLINLERGVERDFARKTAAFNAGLAEVRTLDFDFIGNIDADISFEPVYFENILREFESDPNLGIGGGIVYTRIGDRFITHDETLDSVGGAVQLFRRKCFEDVGGYLPLKYGGIDAAAEITARMKGWKVRKLITQRVYEYRRTGSASAKPLAAKVREGRRFYSLGYSPLFYLIRCLYRLGEQPAILGSMAAFWGYLSCLAARRPAALAPETIQHLRGEQRRKMWQALGADRLRGVGH